MTLYRRILKQALSLTWDNKYLWFFGLFAALLGGGEYEIVTQGFAGSQDLFQTAANLINTNVFSAQTLSTLSLYMRENTASFIVSAVMALVFLVVALFLVWLSNVSQAALVSSTASIGAGKKQTLRDGLDVGIKNFWPVLGYNFITKAVIYTIFILISLPVVFSASQTGLTGLNLAYIISFIVFIPAIIALSFIFKYAIAFKVIKGSAFGESVKRGWRLFMDNWLVSLEMAFILFFLSFVAGLAIILAILLLAVPFLFLAMIFYYTTAFMGFWLVIILALLVFLCMIILAGSILSTFQIAAWTSLFVELSGRGATAKIVRLVNDWGKK